MRGMDGRLRAVCSLFLLAGLFAAVAYGQSQETARRIFDLTNQDRAARGLPPLQWDAALASAAQTHAAWMVREGAISHRFPGEPDLLTRTADAGAHFQAIAENVAIGPRADAIEDEWMHSMPHRTNILDPKMNALGVGIAERDGTLYAVEDFSEASEVLGPEQVERRVRELLRARGIDPSAPAEPAEQACAPGHGIPAGAKSMVRFQTPNLQQLPPQVAAQIEKGHFARAAVGACAPDAAQGAFTVYRVAILLY